MAIMMMIKILYKYLRFAIHGDKPHNHAGSTLDKTLANSVVIPLKNLNKILQYSLSTCVWTVSGVPRGHLILELVYKHEPLWYNHRKKGTM